MQYDKRVREKGETPLEQAHLVMLEMLKVVDAICRKHQLSYWLDAGTLLGIVRHKGFIPWDDDIDICMIRHDYERFIEIASTELPEDLFLQTQEADPSRKSKWLKIRDNYSTFIQNSEKGKKVDYHQGIFIDIFPCEIVNEDYRRSKIFLNRKFQYSKRAWIRKGRWFFNQCATIPVKLLGFRKIHDLILKHHKSDENNYISTGLEVTTIHWSFNYSTIFPLAEDSFLGLKVMIPHDPHHYLKKMYGDYMKIPTKEKQIVHAYKILPFTKCHHPNAMQY